MKTLQWKQLMALCLLLLGFFWLVPMNAQERGRAATAPLQTNWLGYVVFGTESKEVIGGPFPQADKRVEIGLRSDGVVVWRRTTPGAVPP